jgi:hypothetical protein
MADANITTILDLALRQASKNIKKPVINDDEIIERIELIARNAQNFCGGLV